MYTEEEAKRKWCPQVRYTMDNEGSFHTTNGQKSNGFQSCIASDCMMWRWDEDNLLLHPPYKPTVWPPAEYKLREDKHAERISLVGYCGLGGKP